MTRTCTFFSECGTIPTFPSHWTNAREVPGAVDTTCTVLARTGRTETDFDVAIGAGQTVRATALVRIDSVNAYFRLGTFVRTAVIHVVLAIQTLVTFKVNKVHTCFM